MESIFFQISIVEAAENVTQTQALRDSFELLVLLLVEGDVVVLSDIANG